MFIRMYKNLLSPDLCDTLIEKFEEAEAKHTKTETADFNEVNIVTEAWEEVLTIAERFSELVDVYCKAVNIDEDVQFPPQTLWEQFRIKKYKKDQQQFKPHTDNAEDRILAFFVYLNDVEEGGETHFPLHKAQVRPQKGAALVFPCTWEYLHEGKTPLSNDKYILGGYLRGTYAEG